MKKIPPETRRNKIIDLLNGNQNTTVSELSEKLVTQEATIRRDLILLEQKGLIIRTHGGAVLREPYSPWMATNLFERRKQHSKEKKRIAEYVAELVQNDQILMIDGGSTNLFVAEELQKKENLVVVTNNSNIGETLMNGEGFKIYLTGGELVRGPSTMVGNIAEETISHFRADIAILGLNGIVPDDGYFCALPQEAIIKRLMSKYSKETILVTDSSKMNVRSFYLVNDFSRVSKIITDKSIDKNIFAELEAANIDVVLV
jgi:DeoR/GlpR family transcriptional regulator of sugar metabolism